MNQKYSNVNIHQFPSSQFILKQKNRTFRTLHEAINLLHQVPQELNHPKDRYCLKSFNGRDMHFLQCATLGCSSHLLIKSRENPIQMKSELSKTPLIMQFQFFKIDNQHYHPNSKEKVNDCQLAKDQFVDNKMQNSKHHCKSIDSLQYLKYSVRKHNISMHFRDFINCFIQQKDQTEKSLQQNLPYHLPQILKFSQIQVSFHAHYKCLNEKKKTFFYIIEIYAFDEIVTEVKYIASNKTRNPEIFLYLLMLIYVLLNGLGNCEMLMERQVWMEVKGKGAGENGRHSVTAEQRQFIDFLNDLEKNFFSISEQSSQPLDSTENHYIKQIQRASKAIEDSLIPRKITLHAKQPSPQQLHSLKNKISLAEDTYNQASASNTQWRMNEQKPSILRKLNNLFDRQQKQRIIKQNQRQKASQQLKDNNFVNLIESQNEEGIVDNRDDVIKSYMESHPREYLKYALKEVEGDNFWEISEIAKELEKI